MSRHTLRSAGDHISAVAQVSEQIAQRDARIAELEAEVERLREAAKTVCEGLVEEVERLSRRPDLAPEQCVTAADAIDSYPGRQPADEALIVAALRAAAEQEGR